MWAGYYLPVCPIVPWQDGNISQDLTGDEEGRELWEASASQLWSWLCRGRAGCNLHSAHLREQRVEKKPLPPSRKLPSPCGSECRLSYKNGSIAITTPHLSSAPTSHRSSSHSLILKVFRRLEKEETGEWAGDDDQKKRGMGGPDGCLYFITCQNIKSSTRALLWQNDSRGCTIPFSTQMETDTLNGWKSFFSPLAGSSFQRNCDNKSEIQHRLFFWVVLANVFITVFSFKIFKNWCVYTASPTDD